MRRSLPIILAGAALLVSGLIFSEGRPVRPLDRADLTIDHEAPAGQSVPAGPSSIAAATGGSPSNARVDAEAISSTRFPKEANRSPVDRSTAMWEVAGYVDWPRDNIRGGLITEAEPIEMTSGVIDHLRAGDVAFIDIPQAGGFMAVVESTAVGPNGDRSWWGHLEGGVDYSVTFTEGDVMSFGTVITPNGTFLIEAKGNQGWVFRDSLDDLIDTNKSDTMLVLNDPPTDDFDDSLDGEGDPLGSDDYQDDDFEDDLDTNEIIEGDDLMEPFELTASDGEEMAQ